MSDLQMYRGDNFVLEVQVAKNGIRQDITGWFMWFTAKYAYPDPDSCAVTQRTTTDGIVFTDPANGKATITVPPLATRNFPDGRVTLVYDVQVKDLSGAIWTVESGTLTVAPDVTRAIT